MQSKSPDKLYHTTLTVIDYCEDTGGVVQTFYVLGTHSTLDAAKNFATTTLLARDLSPEDFEVYEERISDRIWTHDDAYMLHARALAGLTFFVAIDIGPNEEGLFEASNGTLILPEGEAHLYYVVLTEVNYDSHRRHIYTHKIYGCYSSRANAIKAAEVCLGHNDDKFSQYDERHNLDSNSEWPFGIDVLVHAVGQMGEIFTVSVKTAPKLDESVARTRRVVKDA